MSKQLVDGFADRLREARLALDPPVLQKEVAEYMGRSTPCITFWETGKSEPSLYDLIKLSEFYRVSVEWLLGVQQKAAPNSDSFIGPNSRIPVLPNASIADGQGSIVTEYVTATNVYAPDEALGWMVDTDAMKPAIETSDIVVVERDTVASHGNVYLVLNAERIPTLRRCQRDQGRTFFVADQQGCDTLPEVAATLVGRVREVIKRRII